MQEQEEWPHQPEAPARKTASPALWVGVFLFCWGNRFSLRKMLADPGDGSLKYLKSKNMSGWLAATQDGLPVNGWGKAYPEPRFARQARTRGLALAGQYQTLNRVASS